jgi:NADP-dependent 3-hydroxy acid dehydrogenase YdfG
MSENRSVSQAPKTILVTGASSGIGEAAARALAGAGHAVIAAGRREDRLAALAARHPGITPLVLDVTDARAVDAAIAASPPIDVLVNNAGFAAAGPVETVSEAETRRQFDVNVFGVLNVTRAVLPGMRRRQGGLIVNVSSVVGRVSFPGTGVYSASKHAVEALSDALRAEVKPFGIELVVVEPAFVRTEITQTPPADGALAGGAYRALADATTAYLEREVERGADPDGLAALLVRIVEERRPRTRYAFPPRSRALMAVLGGVPDRVGDAIKLRAIGLRA